MKNGIRIALTFDADLLGRIEVNAGDADTFGDKKRKNSIKKLKEKAGRENVVFRKRNLPKTFISVFGGFVFFSDTVDVSGFAELFFDRLEKDFHINVLSYHFRDTGPVVLKAGYSSKILYFEIFNYNFHEHRAIKTEFTGAENIKKINKLAEIILAERLKTEALAAEEIPIGGIDEQPAGWSLLHPLKDVPVLETGEPREIFKASGVRIYFQKPNVRQVIWRFRDEPKTGSEKPILRVYADDKMLWYERLDSRYGRRYIIFSDDYELYRTWVDIGYVDEKGSFTFIARSPVWPPECLFKSLPKINSKKRAHKRISMIGASEGIPGGKRLPVNLPDPDDGFSGSGAGKIG